MARVKGVNDKFVYERAFEVMKWLRVDRDLEKVLRCISRNVLPVFEYTDIVEESENWVHHRMLDGCVDGFEFLLDGTISEESALKMIAAYHFKVANNMMLMRIKPIARRQIVDEDFFERFANEDDIETNALQEHLQALFEELTKSVNDTELVIIERLGAGIQKKEIAKILQISPGRVSQILKSIQMKYIEIVKKSPFSSP